MITYIIQMDSPDALVKFGRTKNPKSRIASLSTGVPWDLRVVCLFGCDCEQELMQEFHEDRVRGEWFRPTERLQKWIDEQASAGKMIRQVPVDSRYINAVIKPRIREYLNGRAPASNEAGDLVYRILHDGLTNLKGREADLVAATKGHVSAELVKGFGPTPEGGTLAIPGAAASNSGEAAA